MAKPDLFGKMSDEVQDLDYGHEPGSLFDHHPTGYVAPQRWRLPGGNRGDWAGERGDSQWTPHDPLAYGLERGQSVPFVEGVPDFTPYVVDTPSGETGILEVEGLTGDSEADRDLAIEVLADQEGWTEDQTREWLAESEVRVHHFSRNQMQLVPNRLHDALAHTGSASEMRGTAPVDE